MCSVLNLAGGFDNLYLVCGADCGEMMFDRGDFNHTSH